MLHKCLELVNKESDKLFCVDIFRSKPFFGIYDAFKVKKVRKDF